MKDEMNQRSEMLISIVAEMEHMNAVDMAQFITEFAKFTDAIKPLYIKYCVGEKTDFLMKL